MVNFNPNDINAVLAEILSDVKAIKSEIIENHSILDKHNTRISILENFKYWVAGGAAAIGFAFSTLREWIK